MNDRQAARLAARDNVRKAYKRAYIEWRAAKDAAEDAFNVTADAADREYAAALEAAEKLESAARA